jgi:hypothetical protein
MVSYDPNRDAYVILGVAVDATQEEIERAFRQAALTWHPDKSPAPDAAERFQEMLAVARVLRDPALRRDYDLQRIAFHGPRARARRAAPREPPGPYVPMRAPPAWLAERVRIHFDAALFGLDAPRRASRTQRVTLGLALVALGTCLGTGELMYLALAFVLWGYSRLLATPPVEGLLSWAKIVPGRKLAEYHALDQRLGRYDRIDVPFAQLAIAVVRARRGQLRVEIRGFPREAVPVLHTTRDPMEAERYAREAGDWLQLPRAA